MHIRSSSMHTFKIWVIVFSHVGSYIATRFIDVTNDILAFILMNGMLPKELQRNWLIASYVYFCTVYSFSFNFILY